MLTLCPNCGSRMTPRWTALIADCLACGHSLSVRRLHSTLVNVAPPNDIIHLAGTNSGFIRYFDGMASEWRYTRRVLAEPFERLIEVAKC